MKEYLPHLIAFAAVAVAVAAAAHVILNKRRERAAIGWVALIVLSPFLGTLAYVLLGVNRIRRRASRLVGADGRAEARRRLRRWSLEDHPKTVPERSEGGTGPGEDDGACDDRFASLALAVRRATGRELLAGNSAVPLVDGDEAYPRMLAAIERAERSILLSTYIFDNDPVGCRFADALGDAVKRGVEVRVLIDGVGVRYSSPTIYDELRDRGVTTKLFLPSRLAVAALPYFNLRNHRKLLLVDGRTAFAGGLNIRHGCVLAEDPDDPVQDLHFEFRGPVVEPLFQIFAEDWHFACKEVLDGPAWERDLTPAGDVGLQAFGDGPDEDFEALRWTLLAGLTAARRRIRIITPYFLPDPAVLAGLRLAAMRDVEVDILLPEKNNLKVVEWATAAQLWQVLEPGCRVHLVPPPFDHSKAFIVDDTWSLVGSANWDPRSLRLNFELCVACYDPALARSLLDLTDRKMARGRRLTLEEIESRPLPVRLRDGVARLLTPYL